MLATEPEKQRTPQQVETAREQVHFYTRLTLALSLLGFMLLMYTGWLLLAALVFLLAAIVCAIIALVKMPGARASGFDIALLVTVLLACFFFSFNAVVQLIFWEQTNQYASCIRQALTLSRQAQCGQQLRDSFLGSLLGS